MKEKLTIRCVSICPGVVSGRARVLLSPDDAGFGKNGEKNFSGVLNGLQMQTYLVISGYRRKVSRRGAEYGMPVSVYTMPETVWGYEKVTSAYGESASESAQKIYAHIGALFPSAKKEEIAAALG